MSRSDCLNTIEALLAAVPDPVERLSANQERAYGWWVIASDEALRHYIRSGRRLALLDCGHYKVTDALHRAECPRCGAMIRSGYDYHAFRALGQPDAFSWPDDPLRSLHERLQC